MNKKTKANELTIVVDTREQRPWVFPDSCKVINKSLVTGDYSLLGFEDKICIERKSQDDLIACVGQSRERFDKEIDRMRAFEAKAVIVETHWPEIYRGHWRSKISPNAVIGSVLGWILKGVPFMMAGDPNNAAKVAVWMLAIYRKRKLRELGNLIGD